ncbi:AMP-binding protein [Sphaerochaeta sp. PS]|uniref:AMP-binding protein n=1 Tax=Sphaerochaeta sp. PS TaxID=3076336 RepID=UPI0028A4C980|nr:AMP-binding protein [Sphaerochaeta sp. PS]MDT4762824.1 AMP-binding protein [Sphaerochaeta sp. PS]
MKTKKGKQEVWSYRRIRKLKRTDGLKMKTVYEYTMNALVDCTASRNGKRIALRLFGDDESIITYAQMKSMKDSIGVTLLEAGFVHGDKIAILGESCPTWIVAYFGITSIGCVAVPILPDFSGKEACAILEHSGAKGIVVNAKNFEKVLPFVGKNPSFLVRMEDLFHIPDPISGSLVDKEQFASAPGRDITRRKLDKKAQALREKSRAKEDDLASLIYTSGTTGNSKGVMLSHKNLVWNADISTDVYVDLKPGDHVLSILPISHVYEFTTGQILELMCGTEIFYLGKAPATSILLPALKKVRPRLLMSVPLLMEKVYRSSVLPVMRDNEKLKPWLKFGPTKRIISRIIGRKLKVTFGGRLKFFGIGGAPLDREVEQFLADAKFPYSIGYGLTETAPLIAGGLPKKHHVGMIGKLVEHVDVRLDNKDPETGVGEILVKGPNVMLGYYENPKLNEEVFTEDGYFRTGDLGFIDKKGRLAIKGRTKTMILGAGGENIYPELIEAVINNISFVAESLVVPEDGGLIALIKIDIDSFAQKMALNVNDAKVEAMKYVAKIREDVNKELSAFSRISSAELHEEPFQRTPTQKIKRFLYSRISSDKEKK